MSINKQLIHTFYKAFQQKDYKAMQVCYSDDTVFSDPIFKNLNAQQAKAMWEMFCVKSKDLQIQYDNVSADENTCNAHWTATYTFSATGKKVVNKIQTNFTFQNGMIIKHTDIFNFYGGQSRCWV